MECVSLDNPGEVSSTLTLSIRGKLTFSISNTPYNSGSKYYIWVDSHGANVNQERFESSITHQSVETARTSLSRYCLRLSGVQCTESRMVCTRSKDTRVPWEFLLSLFIVGYPTNPRKLSRFV